MKGRVLVGLLLLMTLAVALADEVRTSEMGGAQLVRAGGTAALAHLSVQKTPQAGVAFQGPSCVHCCYLPWACCCQRGR